MKKKNKGFTLIETVIGLGILSIIAILLLPSLMNLIRNSKDLKENPRIIYALEEAIEKEKSNSNPYYGQKVNQINGYDVVIDRKEYDDSLDKISASYSNYHLEVLEVNDEKKRLYFN